MLNLNSLIKKALREQPKIKLLPGSRAQVTTDHSQYILSYSFDRSGDPIVHSCVGVDRETCRGFRFHKVCSHGAALVIYLLDQRTKKAA